MQAAIVLLFDDHRASRQIAQPLVVLRHEHEHQPQAAAESQVDGIEQPAQQVRADGGFAAVHMGHAQVHQPLAHTLPVVEDFTEQGVEPHDEGTEKDDEQFGCEV